MTNASPRFYGLLLASSIATAGACGDSSEQAADVGRDSSFPDIGRPGSDGGDVDLIPDDIDDDTPGDEPDDASIPPDGIDDGDGDTLTDAADAGDTPDGIEPPDDADSETPDAVDADISDADADTADVPPPVPVPNFIVTEIMLDSCAATDGAGTWFELRNVGSASASLNGWQISDGAGGTHTISGFPSVPTGGLIVIGSSDIAANNGGIDVDYVFSGLDFASPAGSIGLALGGIDLFTLTYDLSDLPDCTAASLSSDRQTPSQAVLRSSFCAAATTYNAQDRGTPGTANPVCTIPDTEVDWCRLQFPTTVTLDPRETAQAFVRVFEADITDRTSRTDTSDQLRVEFGAGPDATEPSATSWSWTAAVPNEGWTDTAERGNDEYQAELVAPDAPGRYDYAFRVSLDDGATWLYCDRGAGPGADGAENGYQIANAGDLTVSDPCSPNPCVNPQADACQDDSTLVDAQSPGTCTIDFTNDDGFSCAFSETIVDCADAGFEGCINNACANRPTVSVDFCRLQFPRTITVNSGAFVDIYGRLFISGLTNLSPFNNPNPAIVAQAGVGPAGSNAPESELWTWYDGGPFAGYNGTTAGEPNNDEYLATIPVPAEPGLYSYAYRFSGTYGFSWVYCDLNVGAGQDGSQNGFQRANSGVLTVTDPCAGDPCNRPDEQLCRDGDVVTISFSGVCTPTPAGPDCESVETVDPCNSPEECVAAGTEAFCDFDGVSGGSCDTVDGCTELPAAACEGNTRVSWSAAACSEATCFYAPVRTPCGGATPLCSEGECIATPPPVGYCIVQFPKDVTIRPGSTTQLFGRFFVAGITDRSRQNDADDRIVTRFGFGPDGSNPDGNAQWQWFPAAANPGYTAPDSALGRNDDEHLTSFTAPDDAASASPWDLAFSVSTNGGRTWFYCDRNGGGSRAYDPAQAATLTILPI
jgi:hypothetical protein